MKYNYKTFPFVLIIVFLLSGCNKNGLGSLKREIESNKLTIELLENQKKKLSELFIIIALDVVSNHVWKYGGAVFRTPQGDI